MRVELPEWGERTSEERRQMFLQGNAHAVRGRYMTVVALTELEESRGCLDLGYRSVHELARKEAGWSRRQVCYLLQVGRKLRELRKVDGLLRDGTLCWSKVRLIVSVATLATEADWIRKAQNSTTDQLEHQVQAIREPRLREHRVLLPSVTLRVHRKYAELLKELRAQTGRPELDDETGFEELLDLAARALGRDDVVQRSVRDETLTDAERESSPTPSATALPARARDSRSVDERVAELARTAQPTYTLPDPDLDPKPESRSLPWRHKQAILRRAGHACEFCGNTLALQFHHRLAHERGGTRDTRNLTVCCRRCHAATHELERRRRVDAGTT